MKSNEMTEKVAKTLLQVQDDSSVSGEEDSGEDEITEQPEAQATPEAKQDDFEKQTSALMRLLHTEDNGEDEEEDEDEEPSYDLFGSSSESSGDEFSVEHGHYLSNSVFDDSDDSLPQDYVQRNNEYRARQQCENRNIAAQIPAGFEEISGPDAPGFWDYVVVILVLTIITLLVRRIMMIFNGGFFN